MPVCVRCENTIPEGVGFARRRRGIICLPCMRVLARRKGYDAERDFVKQLEKFGFTAIRIPASAPGKVSLPDVIASRKNPPLALAGELKAPTEVLRYTIYEEQLAKAFRFAESFLGNITEHAKVFVAVKFIRGPRIKSPWIVKFVETLDDVVVDIADRSDMPELTRLSMSKEVRRFIRKRRAKKRAKKSREKAYLKN